MNYMHKFEDRESTTYCFVLQKKYHMCKALSTVDILNMLMASMAINIIRKDHYKKP